MFFSMDELLTMFRALADPTRLRIMLLVLRMELAVGELAQILGQSQPRISRHIRILDEAGLAERRKEGSWVFLRPGQSTELAILQRLLRADAVAASSQAQEDRARLSEVRAARAKMAEQYFAAHADEWDAIRSLHIPEIDVEQAMMALLKDNSLGHMLDIGTGTGRMVELFGNLADQITAIDKSPEMLRLARAKLLPPTTDDEAAGKLRELQKKTDIRLGDFNRLPLENGKVDSVLMHQVLHYAQNPEAVLGEVSRVLAPNGLVMITDFASHDREELRTGHAHARLGFSDESIKRWFAAAQIELVSLRTLDGGELTVKIWVGRKTGLTKIHAAPLSSMQLGQEQKKVAT